MPFVQRYSDIDHGGIIFCGNTLGLSKASNLNAPGVEGSIGAFTSLDTTLQVGAFPLGTTLDYTKNGSRATLNLPNGSSVLYAELVWGGLFRSSANNISNLLNNSITFTTPQGVFSISPDPATAQTFNINTNDITIGFYVRTANVTAQVQAALSGVYSVQSVPALIEAIDSRTSETNHAGWSLAIAYHNPNEKLRNLTIWSGGAVVSPDEGSTTISVANFLTPNNLPITGKVFVSAQEGDAVLDGDQMLFGKTIPLLGVLSGPNNPQDNFFASQINDKNGILDTSGTFGTRNANAFAGTNTIACRQGWDITAVDVSNQLEANQSTAVIRFTSDGDLYVPNALALQIDSKGANLEVTKSADKSFADIGEQITYTITIKNTGDTDAINVIINDLLPPETVLVPNSITVNGVAYGGSLPVTIATIAAGGTAIVEFKAEAVAIPQNNPIQNIAKVEYTFFPFSGVTETAFADSNSVSVLIISKDISIVKSVDKNFAIKGEILTYTSVITNHGNINVNDIYFVDQIPIGTTFVPNSVFINGINVPANPEVGFNVPNLPPNASTTISFQVKVN